MHRARSRSGISDRDEEMLVLSQMFRSLANSGTIQRKRGRLKKAVQQGRRAFGARSVHGVREHAKSPRTQLAAFSNIPRKGSEDLATSSASVVDQFNLGQALKNTKGPLLR
jgi:hypothetical protein